MKTLAYLALAIMTGCVDAADAPATSLVVGAGGKADGAVTFVDQHSADVTILQAWAGDMYCRSAWCAHPIDRAACDGDDCSLQVAEAARLDDGALSPLANAFLFPASAVSCRAIELRALIRKEAFEAPSFTGIGFAMSGTSCGDAHGFHAEGQFVPVDELHRVGVEVPLRGGGTGYVLRFLAQRTCAFGGDSGSLSRYGKTFRPFAQFRTDDGGRTVFYNNWDRVERDYQLGCVGTNGSGSGNPYVRVESFDRQRELLAL
jgi:hypothetical protein